MNRARSVSAKDDSSRGQAQRTPTRAPRGALISAVAVLTVYGAVSVLPFLVLVGGSLKTRLASLNTSQVFSPHMTLTAFGEVWFKLHFTQYFMNSALVTGVSILLSLAIYTLAAYAFAVVRFPGRRILYGAFLAVLFVPAATTLLPLVIIETDEGLINSRTGLVLPFTNGVAPLAILLLTTYYRAIPASLRESAKLDGASERQIFMRIYFPLGLPPMVTVAVLTFVSYWNEYLFTSVSLSSDSKYTLPLGFQALLSENVVYPNDVMAAALILVIPVIVIFVCLQRYFVNGIAGSVRG